MVKPDKVTEEQVILVNENDEPIGQMGKLQAHEEARLHRAFSVFILNDNNELMLQQRAGHKYHPPLLWTNTCCRHQPMGETSLSAGKRRLDEEMAFVTELIELCSFIYTAPCDNGLTEHEFDHVIIGDYNDEPRVILDEVAGGQWENLVYIREDIRRKPEIYTAWLKTI